MIEMLTTELAIFVVGLLGMLLFASYILRNWAAGVMWSLSTIVLMFAGLFDVGLELFWLSVIGTLILLMAGMVVRWVGI